MDLEALERLARLRDSGALSDEEFAVQKQRLLDSKDSTRSLGNGEPIEPRASNTARNLVLIGLVVAAVLAVGFWLFSARQATPVNNSTDINPVKTEGATTDSVHEVAQGGGEENTEQPDAPAAIIPPLPSFRDYSVPTTDLIAPLQLAGHQLYRTMLRNAYKSEPNFGANAVFVTWHCGMGCSMGELVDRSTGLIIDSPVSGDKPFLDFKTQHGSNLLLANWSHEEDKAYNAIKPECVFEAFEFVGGQFKNLAGFPKKEAGSCPE